MNWLILLPVVQNTTGYYQKANSIFPLKKTNMDELTVKEQVVLSYLTEGKSYAAMAEIMSLAVNEVRYYLRHIYKKLNVNTRAEAVAKGFKKPLDSTYSIVFSVLLKILPISVVFILKFNNIL